MFTLVTNLLLDTIIWEILGNLCDKWDGDICKCDHEMIILIAKYKVS